MDPETPDTRSHGRSATGQAGGWTIEMFHDGECPLCRREVDLLRRLDRKGKIRFTDISAPDFDPARHGKDLDTLMAEIHGRRRDGTWLRGVEVFRQLYTAIGLGPLASLSRLPVISQVVELGYRQFARNRLRLTGRCGADGESCRLERRARPSARAT